MAEASETADAWLQHHELLERFSKEWEVRRDLKVTAYAWNRRVELGVGLGEPHPVLPGVQRFHYTKRNVDTMRELADVLLAACDFVEGNNPKWAEGTHALPPDRFELVDGERRCPYCASTEHSDGPEAGGDDALRGEKP